MDERLRLFFFYPQWEHVCVSCGLHTYTLIASTDSRALGATSKIVHEFHTIQIKRRLNRMRFNGESGGVCLLPVVWLASALMHNRTLGCC